MNYISSREEFRNWLKNNSKKENEVFVLCKRCKPSSNVFSYIDAVEEAICFGWIDSIYKKIDGVNLQRFSPRKKNSPWTELNKERARRLIKLGLMDDEGKKILPNLDKEFKIPKSFINLLIKNEIYETFLSFPALYQRIRVYNILFYKDLDKKMYKAALKHFIEQTKKGKIYGEWNDYGRLINY